MGVYYVGVYYVGVFLNCITCIRVFANFSWLRDIHLQWYAYFTNLDRLEMYMSLHNNVKYVYRNSPHTALVKGNWRPYIRVLFTQAN